MQNKKFMALIAVLGMLTGIITGCSEKKDGLTIGIAKIVQHDALDQVEQGIIDAVTDAGFDAQFDLQNANGDVNTAAQIAAKYKAEKVDVAVGIDVALASEDTPGQVVRMPSAVYERTMAALGAVAFATAGIVADY